MRRLPADRHVAVVMSVAPASLAIARALGRRGIPVIGVCPDARTPLAGSRFLGIRVRPGREPEAGLLRFYIDLGQELRHPVLFPISDQDVSFVARHRDGLADHFRFLDAPPELIDQLASKRRFVALAEHYELPLPPTVVPESRAHLELLAPRLSFPCVIKPEFTHLWRSDAARRAGLDRVKALPVLDSADLVPQYERLAAVDGRLVLQHMIVGPDENHVSYHALVGADGRVRAEFAGRKIRLSPPHYGMGCYVESSRDEETLEEGRRVVSRIGYTGVADVDFKRSALDGKLYLLEVNPRFGLWTGLDVACGVDLPFYYYQACLGEPFEPPARYRAGRRWLHLGEDVRSMRTYSAEGTWTWGRWLSSVLRPVVGAFFAWDDPGPALRLVGRRVGHHLRRLAGRGRPPADPT